MDRPVLGPNSQMRMVARTGGIEEANQIAERYEAQGYETEIVKKNQAGLTVYEVWAGKKPEIFSAPAPI
jgi:hypothetical protein